ncbi:MAG: 16S rRNA (guanine(527)-N(7))-methyltransferase RsmG [Sphingomonadales bacterium]|nr:16S rRNA (guanine(527)-N(7))-methyltransferase RsmG [Sphingomonadales bacterium]
MILDSEDAARAWLETLPEWDGGAGERIERLVALLRAENERQNLVAAASLGAIWQRHIADSAQLLPHVPREAASPWLDLGAGAGFPGLVVAALRPDSKVHLVESRKRRIDWLESVCGELGLANVAVHGCRVEALQLAPVRVISARAFAPLPKLLDLSARFSTADTVWLLPKGRSAQHELDALSGWSHMFHVEQSLTDREAGVITGTLSGRTMAAKKGRKS